MTQSPELRRLVRLAAGFNRKARAYGVPGQVSAMDLLAVEYGTPYCYYCGISLEYGQGTFDHEIALAHGGPNRWNNIRRACVGCNRKKFLKSTAEYTEHTELLVTCEVCGKQFQPRWAEYQRGMARTCSRSCSARKRWRVSAS